MTLTSTERLRRIWKLMSPYKVSFASLLTCITVISLLSMFYPYLFGMMINEIFYHKNIAYFQVLGLIFVILFIGERLIHYVQSHLWIYLATKFLFDIRNSLYEKIFMAKAGFLSNVSTGDLISHINYDTDMFMELIHMNTFNLFNTFVRFALSVFFISIINYKLALLLFIVVPVSIYLSLYFGGKVRAHYNSYRENYGRYVSWVFEILEGMRDVQLLGSVRNVSKMFVKLCANIIRLNVKTANISLVSERFNRFIELVSDLSLYIVSGLLIIEGSLNVGGFLAVIEYFAKANQSLKSLNEATMKIQNNLVSIDRVFSLLANENEPGEQSKEKLKVTKGEITYQDVSFSYQAEKPVLKGVNLKIGSGEHLALVGQSGVGKSTMISLLLRLYEPERGRVLIDGMDLADCSLRSIRKSIGVVHQDALIFDGTIRENLLLGKLRADDAELWEACRKANVFEFVQNLPTQLDTYIGRMGLNLSGGQKQRLAIARILLKNPQILIFDEATSALDYESEQAVQNAWQTVGAGKTTIIIAHRLTTILNSDRVAVIHEGEIVACDHHLRLLETCPYYQQLFYEQYQGQREAAG